MDISDLIGSIKPADIIMELERRKYRKIDYMFPSHGKLSWKNYPKHMEFIEATSKYKEAAFQAANRCITPWTYLSNNQLALEAVSCSNFDVQAWDGEKLCSAQGEKGFLKGILPAFRLVMDNGQFLDCSGEHQLLTDVGFLSLHQLVSLSSGWRLNQRREGYEERCVADGYLCDPQLHPFQGSDLGQALELHDAQAHSRLHFEDEAGDICQRNRLLKLDDQLTTLDDLRRRAGLFLQFSFPYVSTPALQLSDDTLNDRLLLIESIQGASSELTLNSQCFGGVPFSLELQLSLSQSDILIPYKSPALIGGRVITHIVPLGLQPIIDFHVPIHNNYVAGGVINHNSGKSECGAFAMSCWLTGEYPSWWKGRVFTKKVTAMVCGETAKLVRDSVQRKLLGPIEEIGTGLIPKSAIIDTTPKSGIPGAIEMVRVRHRTGKISTLQFMSYDQGRTAFQATERDIIWEDEEPPYDVHCENLIRTMTTQGLVMLTYTPLQGMSETVMDMQRKAGLGHAAIISATWDDAPHLSEQDKKSLWESLPPYQRDARSKGIPQLGSGAVYPVHFDDVLIDDFPIPEHFKRVFGLDVGWNNTAAVWLAWDADADIVYLTHEYKRGQAEPDVHATAIKARGVPVGVIDPASRGRSQKDGEQLLNLFQKALGPDYRLDCADNTVEAGIFDVYQRLTTGRFRIFKSCVGTIAEARIYRRDDKGKIVKSDDHLMDAKRYAVRSGLKIATNILTKRKPVSFKKEGSFSNLGTSRL